MPWVLFCLIIQLMCSYFSSLACKLQLLFKHISCVSLVHQGYPGTLASLELITNTKMRRETQCSLFSFVTATRKEYYMRCAAVSITGNYEKKRTSVWITTEHSHVYTQQAFFRMLVKRLSACWSCLQVLFSLLRVSVSRQSAFESIYRVSWLSQFVFLHPHSLFSLNYTPSHRI